MVYKFRSTEGNNHIELEETGDGVLLSMYFWNDLHDGFEDLESVNLSVVDVNEMIDSLKLLIAIK